MGSCCCYPQNERGGERTPIVQPNVEEATDRLEKQKKSLEDDIEKLKQQLQENSDVKQKRSLQKRIIQRQNSLQGVDRRLNQLGKAQGRTAGRSSSTLTSRQQSNTAYNATAQGRTGSNEL